MTRRASISLSVLAIAFSAVPPVRAVDLRNVLNGYSLSTWGINDGLPSSEVLSITQDIDGWLWLGTDTGLVRFDGTRFTAWPGLPGQRSVRTLMAARSGDVWAGLGENGGVLRYERVGPGVLRLRSHYAAAEGLSVGSIRALAEDTDGSVWAGHLGGLFKFANGRWTGWKAQGLGEAQVHALAIDGRGRLVVGTRRGVRVSTTADRARFDVVEERAVREEPVPAVSIDPAGGLWRTDGVHGFKGALGAPDASMPAEIGRGQRLLHDRAGFLWVGTGGQGLWRVSPGASGQRLVEQSTVTTGLLGNGVVSVFQDRDGNIWAGTLDGLNRLTRYVARPVQGLGLVSGVEASPHGIWVMTADSLLLFPPGESVDAPLVKHRGEVRAIHADEAGRLWMSTGGRLWRFDRDGRHEVAMRDTSLRSIALLASDRRGGVWVYDTTRGLQHRTVSGLEPATLPPHLQRASIAWMDTERDGTLWLATTDQRLVRIDSHGGITEHAGAEGLPTAGTARAWHNDRQGSLWVAGSEGLMRIEDGSLSAISEVHGHSLEAMTALIDDDRGHLWLGTRSGLLRVSADDLRRHVESPREPVPLSHLTKADGLAGNPRWYGHRGAVRDARGRLWFVTSRGLSIVDPREVPAARSVDAGVDSVVVDGQTVTGIADGVLPAGTKRLDIQFAALALTSPATIRFRYRLEGFDGTWVDAGSRRHASYTNLAPGGYRFRVMATNTDGTWPEAAAAWSFGVEPMFYQTRGFVAACLLAALGLVGMIWRLHLRRVRAEMSILLAERGRLAREIHDTLLQGLFGIALRCDAIAAEVEKSAPQISSHFLAIRQDVQEYVREARQSILGLRSPTLDRVSLAAALRATGEQLTARSRVSFAFESIGEARPCQKASEEHLLRIGTEAIANAVRHAHPTAVRTVLRYAPGGIVLQVADNGHGFDPDAPRFGGEGLDNVRERAAAAGGDVRIRSEIGQGTLIEVEVPYDAPHAGA